MKHRHERRALAADGDIRRAKIMDDRDAERAGERRSVADLDRQPSLRAVQDRLAVKADDVDLRGVKTFAAQKRGDGCGVRRRHEVLRRADGARSGRPVVQPTRGRQRGSQNRPFRRRVRNFDVRAETDDGVAVGVDERDVDAVHRRAAHEADSPAKRHRFASPQPCGACVSQACHSRADPRKALRSTYP